MEKEPIDKITGMLVINEHRLNTLIKLLIEKNIISKKEFNEVIDKEMDSTKDYPEADAQVIDELKQDAFIK